MSILPTSVQNIDPDNYEGSGFDPIPAGRYNVMITDSSMHDTNAGDGQYLKLAFKVIEGKYSERMIWTNLNLINKNEKTVEIANRELVAICRSIGLTSVPEDSQELHGEPLNGKVKIIPAQGQYDATNSISFFREYSPE